MNLASRDLKTPNVSYIAKDMVVACRNHMSTNLYRRLKRWVSLQLENCGGGDHKVKQAMHDIGSGSEGKQQQQRSVHVSRVVEIVRELMAGAKLKMPAAKNLLSECGG